MYNLCYRQQNVADIKELFPGMSDENLYYIYKKEKLKIFAKMPFK